MTLIVTDTKIERIAFHEAGHVAAWRHFDRTTFVERGYVLISPLGYGRTALKSPALWGGRTQPPPITRGSGVAVMAGRAAEVIRYPQLPHAELVQWSEGDALLASEYACVLFDQLSAEQTSRIIQVWEREAIEILRSVWAGVKALVEFLLMHRQIGPDGEDNCEIEISGAEAIAKIEGMIAVTG